MTLTHVDLFSGIGGFSLAADWAGFTTTLFCERNPYCQNVLARHWPGVPIHDDITTLTTFPDRHTDLLTGGFPCQPFSVAGRQRGTADDRHLWPAMLRVIQAIRPTWICGENVPGIIRMALDEVCADLETAGYQVQPLVFPACGVGAWHKRERVFIVAHATGQRLPDGRGAPMADTGDAQPESQRLGGARSRIQAVADADCLREQQRHAFVTESGNGTGDVCADVPNTKSRRFRCGSTPRESGQPTQSRQALSNTDREPPRWLAEPWHERNLWQSEPAVGRVAHGVPGRVDRLRALGNAVVPQQAYVILKAIADEIRATR